MSTLIKSKKLNKPISDALDKKGIKKIWLAKQLGISISHLSNMMNGRRSWQQPFIEEINIVLDSDFKL